MLVEGVLLNEVTLQWKLNDLFNHLLFNYYQLKKLSHTNRSYITEVLLKTLSNSVQ